MRKEEVVVFSRSATPEKERTILWQAGGVGWSTKEKRVALQESGQNDWQDVKYEGTMAKAPPCPERSMKTPLPQQRSSSTREEESQWISVEDRRNRRVAFEERARGMLGYLGDSEDLKAGISELTKNQLETLEETDFPLCKIAQQARNEKGQRIFEIFRHGEQEVCIASFARWNTQLKSLAELEWRCQGMTQEVKLLSERQEVLIGKTR